MTSSLQVGEVVVVVGATGGIGRATAIACARSGRSLVLVGRRQSMLREVADAVNGPKVAARRGNQGASTVGLLRLAVDIREANAANYITKSTLSHFGRVDALVYCAGWNVPDRLLGTVSEESWRTILDTNLTGAFNLTRLMVPVMLDQGSGLLIYISSSAARRPDQSGTAYQASKAGLAALAHATMEECRNGGIRTTVVYPGLTATPFLAHRAKPVDDTALCYALNPDDVAAACLFALDLPPRAHVPEIPIYPARP